MKTQVMILLEVPDDIAAFELLARLNNVMYHKGELGEIDRLEKSLTGPTYLIRTATEKVSKT